MKTFRHNSKLLIIAIVCSFAAGATTQAGGYNSDSAPLNVAALTDNGRLIVQRAADFGTIIYLTLFIDGVQVTSLGRNYRYEAIVRPGQHLLSIGNVPSPYGQTKFTHRRINVRRGQTYSFTAIWEGADTVLETSDDAKRTSLALR